jgi:hypothetical protein
LLRLRSLLSHPIKLGHALVAAVLLLLVLSALLLAPLTLQQNTGGAVLQSSVRYARKPVLLERLHAATSALADAAIELRNASAAHVAAQVSGDTRPRVVMSMLTSDYCVPLSVLWKSVRVVAPDVPFVVMLPAKENLASLQADADCAMFLGGADGTNPRPDPLVQIIRIGKEARPAGAQIPRANWDVSMDKMAAFGFSQFSSILLMDADTLLLAPPIEWFDVLDDGADFAGAVDQFDGCTRREVLNKSGNAT